MISFQEKVIKLLSEERDFLEVLTYTTITLPVVDFTHVYQYVYMCNLTLYLLKVVCMTTCIVYIARTYKEANRLHKYDRLAQINLDKRKKTN